jgi:hypothetical protein
VEIVDPVEGESVDVFYYNLHFMGHGSFSTDRDSQYARTDPRVIAEVLNLPSGVPGTGPSMPSFVLRTAPNPFPVNGQTEIALWLPGVKGEISLEVYDSAGRRVRHLYGGDFPGGWLRLPWDGRDEAGDPAAPGIYHARVKLGSIVVSRKMVIAP